MFSLCALTALLAVVASNLPTTNGFDDLPFGLPISGQFLHGLHHEEHSRIHKRAVTDDQFIAQPIDHSDSKSDTFKHRYFVNRQYSNGTNSQVHILYLEGAYPALSQKVSNETYPHVANAKLLNATVWVLEHRFHGKSLPFTHSSIKNMRVLNSQQAIEDIKYFIEKQNEISKEKAPKWILYGGYYAGSLALWFRQKYPSSSLGVVTSSAPAVAAADFYRYQKNVEDAYAAYDKKCIDNIAKSAVKIRQLIQYEQGRSALSDELKLKPAFADLGLVPNDFQLFYVVLIHFLQIPVHLNRVNVGPFGTKGGIAEVCNIFADSNSDDFKKVRNLVSYIYSLVGIKFDSQSRLVPNDYKGLVKRLKSISDFDTTQKDLGSSRTFLWQQCTELGYFTTTDYSGLVFGSAIPNNFWINLCVDVFGKKFNVDNLKKGVRDNLDRYGTSKIYKGTNAIIVSGALDPIRTLGYTGVSDSSSMFFNATGAAHVADHQPPMKSDLYAVSQARLLITKRLRQWVGGKQPRATRARRDVQQKQQKLVEDHQIVNWHGEIEWNVTRDENVDHDTHENAFTNFHFNHKDLRSIFRRKLGETVFKKTMSHNHKETKGFVQTATITQRVDNFDQSNKNTWKQYFFYNDKYEDSNENVFLLLGGEGPIEMGFLASKMVSMVSWASEYGAALYQLEHRYYGKSMPTDDLSVSNLRLLTSQQALADAAVFITTVNKNRNFTQPRWIAFGGSYPGSLSAWIRLKYPNLVYASIASSAPVQAKSDYFEYMQTVQNSTRAFGTRDCMDNIHRFFAWTQQQLTTVSGRNGIAKLFGLCDQWDGDYINDKDSEFLIGRYAMMIAGTVQYDDREHKKLQGACNFFKGIDDYLGAKADTSDLQTNSSDIRNKFKENIQKMMFGKAKAGGGSKDCWKFSYKIIVDQMREEQPYDTQSRGWVWQTCNELGVAQSTNFGYNIFESTLPVNHFIDMCDHIYGKNRDYVDAHVRYTNEYYGGQENFNGTRVVFVNGSEDPWNPLGVYKPKDKSVTAVMIDGASHCEDMFLLPDKDTEPMKKAHRVIKKVLSKWVY